MNYLLMICGGEEREPSPARMGIEQWVERADTAGRRLLGRPLDSPETAVTVRVRDWETLRSDGPFIESKEYVGGFDVVDCADLDEALGLAADHPVAAFAAVEVRPFLADFSLTPATRDWAATSPATAGRCSSASTVDRWATRTCLAAAAPGTTGRLSAARSSSRSRWRTPRRRRRCDSSRGRRC